VTNQARAYRRLFTQWGWGGGDHAVYVDPRAGGDFSPLERLAPGPRDVLVFHYSAYAPRLAAQLDRPQRKLLVSHNITPAEWFWEYEPMTAVQCTIGREQLPRFASSVDLAAGVSAFNAAELEAAGARETAVVPILFDPARLGPAGPGPGGPPTVLFVGRMDQEKRVDELVRAFAALPPELPAALEVVGDGARREEWAALAAGLGLGERVRFRGFVSEEELLAAYARAAVFVMPGVAELQSLATLEAMAAGTPVIAADAMALPHLVRPGRNGGL